MIMFLLNLYLVWAGSPLWITILFPKGKEALLINVWPDSDHIALVFRPHFVSKIVPLFADMIRQRNRDLEFAQCSHGLLEVDS